MELYEKLIDGEVTIGTFLNLGSAVASECAAIAGFDYVIVDLDTPRSAAISLCVIPECALAISARLLL